MQRRTKVIAAALASAALVTAAAPVASASGGGGRFAAAGLKGSNEVPPVSTGDPDGGGFAAIEIDRSDREVCVLDAAFGGIDTPVLFHIHAGAAGVNGPVVVDFTSLLQTGNTGCVEVDDVKLLNRIRSKPDQYYINVHTVPFMGGAIRGQLVTVQP
jgi:hypothetical protein